MNNEILNQNENELDNHIRDIASNEVDKKLERFTNETMHTKVHGHVDLRVNNKIVKAEIVGNMNIKQTCRRCLESSDDLKKVDGMGERYYCSSCRYQFQMTDLRARDKKQSFSQFIFF